MSAFALPYKLNIVAAIAAAVALCLVLEQLKAASPESLTTEALTLEEIFVATVRKGAVAV